MQYLWNEMRSERLWGSSSKKLALLFLAVVVPPVAALVWLGVQLVQQDRTLWTQREDERRQTSARAAALSLEQALTEAERKFAAGPLPAGVVRFRHTAGTLTAEPLDALLWLPTSAPLESGATQPFAEAETLEYRGQTAAARQGYDVLSRAPQPSVRAGALLRLARIARQEQRLADALRLYSQLAAFPQIAFDGTPADLLARRAACSLREAASDRPALLRDALALRADLLAGRWQLDRSRWELAASDLARWTGQPLPQLPEREAFSRAAEWLFHERVSAPPQEPTRALTDGNVPITILQSDPTGPAIAIAPAVVCEWARHAGQGVALWTPSGRLLAGESPAGTASGLIRLAASATGLPWTLTVATPPSDPPAGRRRVLLLGLAALSLFAAGGTFLLWRVIQRELAVARLQTDFVAAVSHEFRTPLASLKHLTELLEEADDMPRERRVTFYQSLSRNTDRLHRLVESLLDFARMERGRKPYDMGPLDAGTFARDVIEDFRKEAEPRGYRVELEIDPAAPLAVRADASSLLHALWNLLDNAVKYSPEPRPICVRVGPHPRGVALAVQDHGIGVPAAERHEIFDKFVRGQSAGRLGIKGTGLGLAMVDHIVKAHGGTVELESEEGAGSTFRIVLPAQT
jgi:signal transduction histidine kinase